MTTEEARRRQAISHVQVASAREWPRKLLDAWADTLRPFDPQLVERACREAVAAWRETLIMPVGTVVERIRALQRAQDRRRDDDWDADLRVVVCPDRDDVSCRDSWQPWIPGHTRCFVHEVVWRTRSERIEAA